ncbi:MAG TPA: 2-phospho-L-lactate guanylyltransferase [Anaerolineae bacterium]
MDIWTVIPVKAGRESKSRLAHELTAGQRAELVAGLLDNTLTVLNQAPMVRQTVVISRDMAMLEIAHHQGAIGLFEEGVPGLNMAVTQAVAAVTAAGASAALVLPADLPFIQVEDVAMMTQPFLAANGHAGCGRLPLTMAICADDKGEGTNALLFPLPTNFVFQYGVGSFQRHLQEAKRLGMTSHIIRAPGLRFDLDTEEDWRIYRSAIKLPV